MRGFIEELLEQELTAALGGRSKHERVVDHHQGYRNGTRERQLTGSFGVVPLSVPWARLANEDGGTREWRSEALPRYARRTRQVEALIASAYLAGTNTRRVKRALAPLFKGAVGKDVVSRALRRRCRRLLRSRIARSNGARCRRTGRRGCGAILPEKTSCA